MFWVASAAPKPHAGSSDGDTVIDFLSEVVTWSVLVWFAKQRGMTIWVVCDGLVNFRGATDGLLCARDSRTSRCGCSGGPVSREWWISPVKRSTAGLTFGWLASVSGTPDVELDELPDLKKHEEQNNFQKTSRRTRFFRFNSNQTSKCQMMIHFSTNHMKINRTKK